MSEFQLIDLLDKIDALSDNLFYNYIRGEKSTMLSDIKNMRSVLDKLEIGVFDEARREHGFNE